ncbi:MAG: LysM peptidoglycan-binding domain-containing protein [Granulosicoccus sp.]
MLKSTPTVFKKSLLAVAVLSLSACSTMPQVPDLGGVGDGIIKAGKATADVTRRTWNTTAYLLGFTDDKDGRGVVDPSDEQLPIAQTEFDQVLPIAKLPIPQPTSLEDALKVDDNLPVLVEPATAAATDALAPLETTVSTLDQTTDAPGTAAPPVATPGELPTLDETVETVASIESGDSDFLAEKDLVHEVADNENLWNIAKKTTGDANNWHVLADLNNLTQSAMVFPGQKLLIPSSMIKPGYYTVAASPDADQPAAIIDSQNRESASVNALSESTRLTIPSSNDGAASDVPQTDQLTVQQKPAIELASVSQDATAIDLNEGETLWDFAKRTTGNALNWQAIADQNKFTEKQAVTVRPGQTIFVPSALLKAEPDEITSASAPAAEVRTPLENVVATAAISEQPTPVLVEQAAAALPALPEAETPTVENVANLAVDTTTVEDAQPVKIVDATYKTDDELSPITAENEPAQMGENENIPAKVVVSGTYYPKAIYNNADFSSSLLMRVSPGTTLQVSRAMGTWYEVQTEKGVGFVHQRDIQ